MSRINLSRTFHVEAGSRTWWLRGTMKSKYTWDVCNRKLWKFCFQQSRGKGTAWHFDPEYQLFWALVRDKPLFERGKKWFTPSTSGRITGEEEGDYGGVWWLWESREVNDIWSRVERVSRISSFLHPLYNQPHVVINHLEGLKYQKSHWFRMRCKRAHRCRSRNCDIWPTSTCLRSAVPHQRSGREHLNSRWIFPVKDG